MAATFAVPMGVRRATLSSVHRSSASRPPAEKQPPATAAPEVAHRLFEACGGDEQTIAQILDRLSPQQRRGLRSLPDPLPLVPSIATLGHSLLLDDWERDALLVAAVCIDDRLDTLLDAIGKSMGDVLTSALSLHLALVAGRFSFADPRVRIWAHEGATLGERTHAHERLAAVYTRIGDARRSLWHTALGTMRGDSALSDPLLLLSAEATRAGDAALAYAAAREAASHADARDLNRARVVAGGCALSAGWLDDALDWLGPVIDSDDREAVGDALPAFVVASIMRTGAVPSADLHQHRPQRSCDPRWFGYGRASSLAAAFSAERGQSMESRAWFAEAHAATKRMRRPGRLIAVAKGWSELFAIEEDGGEPERSTTAKWSLFHSLRMGLDGDAAGGLRLLAGSERVSRCADGELIVGGERSRFLRAHRAVAEAILRFWSGDLRASKAGLDEASHDLPLALPFAGIAVSLARRLELAIDGRPGSLSAALHEACPVTPPRDALVDRATEAYLSGDSEQAAVQMQLWAERGAPGPVFALTELDEVGPIGLEVSASSPPDTLHARRLRSGIRAARENAWRSDYLDAAAASRQISSPFERARVEALLGTAFATRGDRTAGLRHLRTARTLFAESGADAWARAVDVRLTKLGAQHSSASQLAPSPIPVPDDPLWVCRVAWESLLTERELAVVMLVADGRTNREIASRLFVSVRTVEVHIGRAFTKFDVRSRGELIALAHRTNQLV